jgi:hypothetical protein
LRRVQEEAEVIPTEERCIERVHDGGRYVGLHRCQRRGRFVWTEADAAEHPNRRGKPGRYCSVHFPAHVIAKRKQEEEEWKAELARDEEAWKERELARKLYWLWRNGKACVLGVGQNEEGLLAAYEEHFPKREAPE